MIFEKDYEVVIAGAVISAELVKARGGLRTTLIEEIVLTRGLATIGLVNIYLYLSDGNE